MTEAATLRCPSCGASVAARASECPYCKAQLHPTRCPWCFDWTFAESRDCGRCGSKAETAPGPATFCPTCRKSLSTRTLGRARLSGCGGCGGVWADPQSFKAVCAERETQSAYLGDGSMIAAPKQADPLASPVLYRPCAVCGELMNRFNFANCSGVILDSCRPHGVWFDADELKRIVEFIRGGGLDVAREREKRALELERKRLEAAAKSAPPPPSGRAWDPFDASAPPAIAAARSLAAFLFRG